MVVWEGVAGFNDPSFVVFEGANVGKARIMVDPVRGS
jgi:hypothetical protein